MVSGEVDLSTAPNLTQALEEVLGLGNQVVVDLEEVRFMDCSGLRALVQAARRAEELGAGRLHVTPGPRQVRRLFELTGAAGTVQVVPPSAAGVGVAA